MNITIGIPTGGRAEQAVEVARSWIKRGIRVIMLTWDSETEAAFNTAKLDDNAELMYIGDNRYSFAVNQNTLMGQQLPDWDVWICGADDLWSGGQADLKERIELVAENSRDSLIWVGDGCMNQQPTHPIITRAMYENEGPKVLCEDYKHNFVDTDLFARMLKKHKVVKCFDIMLDHRHHLTGRAKVDKMYEIGGQSYPEDAIIYHKKFENARITKENVEILEIE